MPLTSDELRAAAADIHRARAEIEMLASIAGGPRQAIDLLRAAGIGLADMTHDDTAAIYLAIEWASDPTGAPRSPAQIGAMAAYLLRAVQCWDDTDPSRYADGSRWGYARLAHVITAIDYDPALVRCAAGRLRADSQRESADAPSR